MAYLALLCVVSVSVDGGDPENAPLVLTGIRRCIADNGGNKDLLGFRFEALANNDGHPQASRKNELDIAMASNPRGNPSNQHNVIAPKR